METETELVRRAHGLWLPSCKMAVLSDVEACLQCSVALLIIFSLGISTAVNVSQALFDTAGRR